MRSSWRAVAAAAAILIGAGAGSAHDPHDLPGPAPMEFVPPPPGSYVLHGIMPAPEGRVLGLDGRAERLSRYTRGQITLLGFIYTACVDPLGCPHAYRVFDALKEAIAATPALRGKVRFVTLSFDYPAPEVELEILQQETAVDARTGKAIVALLGKLRAADTLALAAAPSTRLGVAAARLIRSGVPARAACAAAIVEPLTDDPEIAAGLHDLVALVF